MLEARKITKYYEDRVNTKKLVLQDCDLLLQRQTICGLMGESGSGKSTLARILLGVTKPDSGEVFYQKKAIAAFNKAEKREWRRTIQFISQRPEAFFDPKMKLGKSLLEVLAIWKMPVVLSEVCRQLEAVNLKPEVLQRYPFQLSGGELQRLSICRALLVQPEILILDEPTSMLDISVQAEILHMLKSLQREKKMTYLFISHDFQVLNWLCDEIKILKDGKLEAVE